MFYVSWREFLLGAIIVAHLTSSVHSQTLNFSCAPTDNTGGPLDTETPNPDGSLRCRYEGAGVCRYFDSGNFESGSSECPRVVRNGEAGTSTTVAEATTEAPPPVETTPVVPPPAETTAEAETTQPVPDLNTSSIQPPAEATSTLQSLPQTDTATESAGSTESSADPSASSDSAAEDEDDANNSASSLNMSVVSFILSAGFLGGLNVL